MTYLHYIILLENRDREQHFSAGATRLYLKLLAMANGIANGGTWPVEFTRSDAYVAGACGCAANSMKSYREELKKRGLIGGEWGTAGRTSKGIYRLVGEAVIVSEFDTFSPNNLSNSDTISPNNLSEFDTISEVNVSEFDTISPKNPLNVSGNVSKFDTLEEEEDKESIGAALAASPALTTGKKFSAKNPKKGPKKTGAMAEEIAALELPHPGAGFASLWALFLTGSKQLGKSLNAHQMALLKLGRKPEAFAIVMLEAAIQGDWVGVENPGTARAFEEWLAQQAKAPAPATAAHPEPELNLAFIAEQEAAAATARTARFNRYAAV